jgi:hypothetical protein
MRMRRILPFILLAWSVAQADDLSTRYPAGSITTREQVRAALDAAAQEHARLNKDFAERDAACYSKFLVNDCRSAVRRERELARRQVNQVELEAKETRRRLDQEDAARRRAEQDKQQAIEDEGRAAREARAQAQAKQRQDNALAAARKGLTPEEEASNRAAFERKQTEHAERLAKEQAGAPERSQNAAAYEQKQADAAKRAEASAAEAKRRQTRRAERKVEQEKKEAEREAIRQRAEEAAKSLPR